MDYLSLVVQNLTSPALLFFGLGLFSGLVRSDLSLPDSISRYLSLFLMMAIGLKGGVALANQTQLDTKLILTLLAGIGFGVFQPVIGYCLLRLTTALDQKTAAAVSAHYGSVSVVTFAAAVNYLKLNDMAFAGYMAAVLALMEAPAILSGLFLAQGGMKLSNPPKLIHHTLSNGAVLLLLGSFVIGWGIGQPGLKSLEGFIVAPYQGILCLFLLDMGLLVARTISSLKSFRPALLAFGLYMPLIGAGLGFLLGHGIGLDRGSGFLLTILFASASYIAVPAAMRMALPEADAGIYVPLSLGVTFPLNLCLGLPLYYQLWTLI